MKLLLLFVSQVNIKPLLLLRISGASLHIAITTDNQREIFLPADEYKLWDIWPAFTCELFKFIFLKSLCKSSLHKMNETDAKWRGHSFVRPFIFIFHLSNHSSFNYIIECLHRKFSGEHNSSPCWPPITFTLHEPKAQFHQTSQKILQYKSGIWQNISYVINISKFRMKTVSTWYITLNL